MRRRVAKSNGELRGECGEQNATARRRRGRPAGGDEDEHRAERVAGLAEPSEHAFEPDPALGELEDVAEHHPRGDAERHELERKQEEHRDEDELRRGRRDPGPTSNSTL